jgi:16S rRNA (cytosine967-C5)-methyltransferase
MRRSSLFGHVIELYDVIRGSRRPADLIVKEFFRARHYLGGRDRRFISEMTYGLVRHFKLIQIYAEEVLQQNRCSPFPGGAPSIVLLGIYLTKLMHETPDALVPDLCGLWRVYVPDNDCKAFLEAASSVSLPATIERNSSRDLATRFSLPETVVQEWIERYGVIEAESLCASLNSPAPIAIRVNTLATNPTECQAVLLAEGIDAQRTTLSPVGLRLSKRINAQAIQSFKRGYFELQDEGSQLISMLVGATPGSAIVDACAGGGGKTLHLAAIMNNTGNLLAIDTDENRLNNIRERLRRARVSNVRLCLAGRDREAIADWQGKADAVLVDAPCSGVGTFRRNPGAKLLFTEEFVDTIAMTQQEVLEQYSKLVKPGGRLVYSTCTLLKKENEDRVAEFLSHHADFELLSAREVLSTCGVVVDSPSPFLTLFPHKTTTDGFFAAVMRRRQFVDS